MEAIEYYTNSELREELRRRNYDKDLCVMLDLTHSQQLQEIVEKFYAANWGEREKIYKTIMDI